MSCLLFVDFVVTMVWSEYQDDPEFPAKDHHSQQTLQVVVLFSPIFLDFKSDNESIAIGDSIVQS